MKVNYNVTGNDRKALVKVIGETIGEKPKYLGMPSAAFQIGNFTVSKTGELECEDGSDTGTVLEAIAAAGFTSEDAPAPEEQTEETNLPDFDGLTVQVPRHTLTDTALDNLNRLVESKATLIKKAIGADSLRIEVTDERVSFPWFQKTTPEAAHAYTVFVAKLCEMAKNATRVTATDHEVENPKYSMRCFLLRLGFIGAEYKADRKILLQNLSGSSAFKSGQKNEKTDEVGADNEISE